MTSRSSIHWPPATNVPFPNGPRLLTVALATARSSSKPARAEDRGSPALRLACARRASRSPIPRSTTATTSSPACRCSTRCARPASRASSSARRPPSTARPGRRRSRSRPKRDRSTPMARRNWPRGRPALVRRGVRHARLCPALFQRRRGQREVRRGPLARDAPHPQRPARDRRRAAADGPRHRLPNAGRDVHPRLHRRARPCRGTPGCARADGQVGGWAGGAQPRFGQRFRCARSCTPPKPSPAGASRTSTALGAPEIRPCSSPPTSARARCWAGRPSTGRWRT